MSPEHFEHLTRVREHLAAIAQQAARAGDWAEHDYCLELRDGVFAVQRDQQPSPAPRVVFLQEEEPDWWLVGPEGGELRQVHGPAIGVRAAHAALGHQAPLCATFAAPGARFPGHSVREAVRVTGAAWAENVAGCPELASAMRSMFVRGDPPRLQYAPRPGAAVFSLSLRPFPPAP